MPRACQGVPAEDGKNLLLGGSPEELAACALRLIEDEPLRIQLAAAGRRTVQEELTWSVVAAQFRQALVGGGADGPLNPDAPAGTA